MMANTNPLSNRVLKALRAGPLTAKEIAEAVGAKHIAVQKMMTSLREELLVHATDTHMPYRYALGAGSANWTAPEKESSGDLLPPRRKAVDVTPFRDELQAWFFGQPGQEVRHDAR